MAICRCRTKTVRSGSRYNGEIYNFADLRRELEGKGHRFRSHTDTEAIIHLYEEYGADCLNRLNGMFAFAICDLRGASPKLFLARDHFGIKPLYYRERSGKLAFASEVKALLEVPGIEARMNMEALHQYLTFFWVPDPLTMFEGIRKLRGGPLRNLASRRIQDRTVLGPDVPARWPSLRTKSKPTSQRRSASVFAPRSSSRWSATSRSAAFLSAGLDSSSIVAAMARKQPVRTYTITFPEKYRVGETAIDDPAVPQRLARESRLRAP